MPPGVPDPAARRSAQQVIDAAIRETRVWEWVCLGFIVVFAGAGIALLVVGAVRGDAGLAWPGVGVAAMYMPAFWAAARFRERNIRLRLIEIPLGMAKSAREASQIVDAMFPRSPGGRKSDASG